MKGMGYNESVDIFKDVQVGTFLNWIWVVRMLYLLVRDKWLNAHRWTISMSDLTKKSDQWDSRNITEGPSLKRSYCLRPLCCYR